MASTTTTRLSKGERREQLLDVAASIIVDQGAGALTMERLAQHAGVSKALPYLHFDNADEVLRALFEKEVLHLVGHITEARVGIDDGEERLRAAVVAYFEVVEERGTVFIRLESVNSTDRVFAPDSDTDWVAGIIREDFDITPRRARVVAVAFLGALNGLTTAWADGRIRRKEAIDTAAQVAIRLARSED